MDRSDWNEFYEGAPHLSAAGPDPLLPPEVAALVPGRALDLACGAGGNALWLAQQGWRVTGVDLSDAAIASARSAAAALGVDARFLVGDLAEYDPKGPFDLVTFFYVHLPPEQRASMFGRAAAALAPGGTLLYVGHDRTDPGVGAPGHGLFDEGLLTTPADVAAELTGLEIQRREVVEHVIDGTHHAGKLGEHQHGHAHGHLSRSTLVRAVRRG